MGIEQTDSFLLVGAAVLLAGILAVRVSVRVGLPSLLLYLGLGLLLGDAALGIRFDDADVAHALGFAALVVILAEGGLTTKWSHIRPSIGVGLALATVGIAVSIVVVAVAVHVLLGFSWQLSFLLAAVTSPTDAAAVFSVLRRVPLKRSTIGALEAESGLNDAPTVIVVLAISTGSVSDHSPAGFLGLVVFELIVGAVLGYAVGRLGAAMLRGAALPSSGLYPLAVLALTVVAYGGAAELHASGFAAVYVSALVLGNADLPHGGATRSFAEGFGWLAQIGLFVMLGLLASPELLTWDEVWSAVAAGAVLTFVARPLSVIASVWWARMPVREQIFVAWAGLRGAVPIVLATIPLAEGVPGAQDLFDVVFVFVVVYTVLQAPTLPWAARRLGLIDDDEARELEIDAAPLDRIGADLLQVRVPSGSRLSGLFVRELRLPAHARVTMIVRDGQPTNAESTTRIRTGDDLLVVAPAGAREPVERRLRDVAARGRLAGWHQSDP